MVMSIGTLLVLVVVGALVAWKLGSIVLRALGLLLFALGLAGLALPGSGVVGEILLCLAGAAIWLAGHWLFAFRHHVYRSALAQRVFLSMLPSRLDPTRNWAIRSITSDFP